MRSKQDRVQGDSKDSGPSLWGSSAFNGTWMIRGKVLISRARVRLLEALSTKKIVLSSPCIYQNKINANL